MERKKYFLILIILIVAVQGSASAPWKAEIYQAYINNKMSRWKQIIDEMEEKKTINSDYLSHLVNYQYGYIAWCIGNDLTGEARKYLGYAENNLELLSEEIDDVAVVHAYQSAFYGYKIGMNRLRAPFYGPRSINQAKLAIRLNDKNPMGYIQYGNSQFYMPAVFGGSKEVAIEYFRKAQELMEQNESQIKNDWNYLSLLTTIAQSYDVLGQYDQAQEYYELILKVEPEFQWVKNELYPAFLKKQKQQP